jgi:hypothetical protein
MTGTVHQNRDYPKFEKNVREDMDYFIISDESMFWSCLFVLLPSLSYCYSLSKTKPVLQGYSREKILDLNFQIVLDHIQLRHLLAAKYLF